MFQLDDCATCGGTCNPTEHCFPPIQDNPPDKEHTPNTSPNSRNTRQNPAASPTTLAITGDDSADTSLADPNASLFPGQQQAAQPGTSQTLQDRISTGAEGIGSGYIDIEAELAKNAERFQAAIDLKHAEEEKRRQDELAKAKKPAETPAQILARRLKEQEKSMQAAANKRFREEEAAHKRALELEKAKAATAPPRRNSDRPTRSLLNPSLDSAKRKRSSSARQVGFVQDAIYPDSTPDNSSPEKLSSSDDDDDAGGPFTTRGLVKYMSQSFAKALEQHDRKTARRVSIQNADINTINGVPHGAPSSGKLSLQTVPNTSMAARLGLAPAPNLEIIGDPTDLDYKKIHKHMQSGSKRSVGQFVSRQANWPEEFLSNNAPGKDKTEFKNLTFIEFIDGMLAKCMLETPNSRMDDELANKLHFLREVVAMHYSMGIKDILAITERFLRGWESKNFEWNNWPQIELFLREAKYQQICTAITTGNINKKAGGGGGAGNGGAPPPKGGSNVYGIPTEFLRNKKLCIKFNKDECPEKADHKQPHQDSVWLSHKCAGCMKNGVTPEKEHGVKSCPKGPYKTPFRV